MIPSRKAAGPFFTATPVIAEKNIFEQSLYTHKVGLFIPITKIRELRLRTCLNQRVPYPRV